MKGKYVIQVVPLIPLPVLRTQVFSYWHTEPLPAGTLVAIPFYFREIQGIVIRSHQKFDERGSIKLKNIKSVVEKEFLSENQVKLAQEIANHFFSPLGSVMKLMVPRVVKQRKKREKISKKTKASRKIEKEARKIAVSDKNKFLLMGNSKRRDKINFDLIGLYLKKNKQCLILVPEIFFAHNVYEKIQKGFSEEIALVHSRITKGQFYDQWQRIRSGDIKIVIATKQGIFLPFFDLGIIIVEEEQDISFKQWESMPRYHAVRGAEFLAELAGAKLVLESSTPSAESYHRADKKELELIKIEDDKNNFPKVEVVSLEKEKNNPDFPISQILYGYLAEAARNKKQAVLFVNRRGFSTRTICENCKRTLKCPACDRALVYSDELGQYKCLHCSHKMDLLSVCPSCGGSQFSHRGIGTQTVEKRIRKLFPSLQVARLDADALRSPAKYLQIFQKFSAGEIDVLVGTQSIIKGIASEKTELVGTISGRDFADGVEFNSRELALSRVFQAANLLGKNGSLVVQSFWNKNPLFDYLQNENLKKFYNYELEMRKKYSYPPFRKFVKLIYRDKMKKKVQVEMRKTFDLLQATGNNEIEIIAPYEPISLRKRGWYSEHILIKFDSGKNIRDLPIRSVIGGLRKGWSVDIDPVTIS